MDVVVDPDTGGDRAHDDEQGEQHEDDEEVAVELDTNRTFIDVIPENKIKDIEYIQDVVNTNKRLSRQIRREIRRYGIDTFGLENILAYEYIPKLKSLL